MEAPVHRAPRAASVAVQPVPAGRGNGTALVAGLMKPASFPHAAGDIVALETHISHVVLAGPHAYKIKKPVKLPFLDFSTLDRRRRACIEEVRVNRRTAPELYLGVVPITGTSATPQVGGSGTAIEYAVHMRRFPQEALFDRMAAAGALERTHADALGIALAALHADAPRLAPQEAHGTPQGVLDRALANFHAIEALETRPARLQPLQVLHEWTLREHRALAPLMAERRTDGFVRECHGDLHLGNVVLVEGRAVPFDAIEFDAGLRLIDVIDDAATAWMDFERVGLHTHAARFLDAYLTASGDYPGLRLLRFYAVYRAMVRAKVAFIRQRQLADHDPLRSAAAVSAAAHLALARRVAFGARPALLLMHGFSGSGKSYVSQQLLEATGAVRLRSDVERKRRHGLPPSAQRPSRPGTGLYSSREDDGTYGRLAEMASWVLASGFPLVIDATFLKRSRRDAFRALAAAAGASFTIVDCRASQALLRERLAERARTASDASDAGIAVLDAQIAGAQAIARDEVDHVVAVDTTDPATALAACTRLVRRVRQDPR